MKLRDYCKKTGGEIEVFDSLIDYIPYYNYDGENTYGDDVDEKYLEKMENWFLSLNVVDDNDGTCTVDCFVTIRDNWDRILKGMVKDGGYSQFLNSYDDWHDEDMIADYVEDVFTTMANGFYGFAKDFCLFMEL